MGGTPKTLRQDIEKMIVLLETGNNDLFVREYFWGYQEVTQTLGPRPEYVQHEIDSVDEHLMYCLKQSLIYKPRKHVKGDGGESVQFLFPGPDGEDVYVYYLLGDYSEHWLIMNPND